MFPDVPSMYFLGQIYHDVGVGDAAPVKQHRYRPNAIKQQYHKEEIKYLLADDFIEPSCSFFGFGLTTLIQNVLHDSFESPRVTFSSAQFLHKKSFVNN